MGYQRREEHTESFTLLYVCTGNVCRSPFAEILTRHLLVDRLGERSADWFDVSSAGVGAVVGAPAHPDTCIELTPWGLDRAGRRFAARQLQPVMAQQADLVLGATTRHRSAVVEQTPAAVHSAFALREFARLAASVDPADLPVAPVARAHALVELARLRRGLVRPCSREDDEVPDPIGLPPDAHHRAAVLIRTAVQTIVDLIAAPTRQTRS